MLQQGNGTHDGKSGKLIISKGIQTAVVKGIESGDAMTVWELDDENAVFVLLTGNAETEGLEPTTIEEAKTRPDWSRWEEAINAELKSLDNTHTWNVVDRRKDTNVVSCKWVFKIKKNAVGEIDKYKARLVARGFTQQYSVDYNETYAPVARLTSLRLILVIAAHQNWDIDIFDFHSAFLNSKLDNNEIIFMELPPGFDKQDCDLIARLCVAIYGSKQDALKWYQRLYATLQDLGFTPMEVDWGVFVVIVAEHILILASHVDDCMVTGSSSEVIKAFKEEIRTHFRITDLGPISWLLGMKVTRDHGNCTISLSQELYVNTILAKYNFTDVKPVSILLDPYIQLSEKQSSTITNEIACMRNIPYRQAVGSLIHLAAGTRPDIAFTTSFISQFNNNPRWEHWEAVKRIYKYLSGTKMLVLTFGMQMKGLVGYIDADGTTQEC